MNGRIIFRKLGILTCSGTYVVLITHANMSNKLTLDVIRNKSCKLDCSVKLHRALFFAYMQLWCTYDMHTCCFDNVFPLLLFIVFPWTLVFSVEWQKLVIFLLKCLMYISVAKQYGGGRYNFRISRSVWLSTK